MNNVFRRSESIKLIRSINIGDISRSWKFVGVGKYSICTSDDDGNDIARITENNLFLKKSWNQFLIPKRLNYERIVDKSLYLRDDVRLVYDVNSDGI